MLDILIVMIMVLMVIRVCFKHTEQLQRCRHATLLQYHLSTEDRCTTSELEKA